MVKFEKYNNYACENKGVCLNTFCKNAAKKSTQHVTLFFFSAGAVIAGYPFATFGKLYGWNDTFFLIQIMAAFNLILHVCARNLDKNMVGVNKTD